MNHETFEDRLLARLTELDAARPSLTPAPRPRRRALLVTASVGAAAAAVVLVAVAGAIGPTHRQSSQGDPVRPASYTVVKNTDGTVTFTVNDLLDLGGATQALNDAGIAGRVLTSTADCTTGPNTVPIDPADLYPVDTYHRMSGREGMVEGDTVTLSSSYYPAGGGLLVTVGGGYFRLDRKLHLIVGYLAYIDVNKIPQCINFVDPGTGDVPTWPPSPRR